VASWQFAEEMIDRLGPSAGAEEGHSRLELFAVRNGLLAHQKLASDVLQKDEARLFSTTDEVG
jgi:hypothetical protein